MLYAMPLNLAARLARSSCVETSQKHALACFDTGTWLRRGKMTYDASLEEQLTSLDICKTQGICAPRPYWC